MNKYDLGRVALLVRFFSAIENYEIVKNRNLRQKKNALRKNRSPRKINERENYDCINLDRQNNTAAGRCRSAKCITRILHANQTNRMQRSAYTCDAPKLICSRSQRPECGWVPGCVCSLCSCASQYVYLFLSFATERQKFRHQHQTSRLRSESTRSHFYFLEFVFVFTATNIHSHLAHSNVDQIFTRCSHTYVRSQAYVNCGSRGARAR